MPGAEGDGGGGGGVSGGGAGEGTWTSAPTAAGGHDDTVGATPEVGARLLAVPEVLPTIGPERYEVSREFARGGLGRILAARDKRLARPVAIKELIRATPENEVRFTREVRITAKLQHPAIVPVYEAGRWPGGAPFYAMRMVKGVPLSAILKEARTLAERIVLLPHLIAVADAMAYAHAQRVVHRDLKPSNILCGSFGETVVIDWGLAKDLSAGTSDSDAPSLDPAKPRSGDETIAGSIMGTPAYMPPEQAKGIAVDERADVYALGAILYHMIAGEACYGEAVSVEDLLDRVKRDAPRPLEAIEPAAPPDLAAIVRKAMAREPADRYATAEGMAEDLHSYAEGRLVGAHRYSPFSLVRRWMGRHRGGVVVTALVAAVLATAGFSAARSLLRDRDAARAAQARAEAATGVERGARSAADERVQRLILAQARSALKDDPTATVAWLRQMPAEGAPDGAMRILAQDAIDQGVAAEVVRILPAKLATARFGPGAATLAYCTDSQDGGLFDLTTRVDDRRQHPACGPADQLDVRFASMSQTTEVKVRAFADGQKITIDDGVRLRTLRGHSGKILALAFSLDGSSLYSASEDGTVRRWLVASHAPRFFSSSATPSRVRGAWFIQGNSTLLTLGEPSGIEVLDLQNGALTPVIPAATEMAAVSVISGQTRFVVVPPGGSQVKVYDATGGKPRQFLVPNGQTVSAVQLLPGGTQAVAVVAGKLRGLNLTGGWLEDLGPFIGGQMRTSADGRMVAVFGGDLPIHVWNAFTHDEYEVEGKPGETIEDAALSPDGALLAAAVGTDIILVELKSGTRRVLAGHRGTVRKLAFSLSGELLVSGGDDGTLRVWEPTAWTPRTLGSDPSPIREIAIAPGGDRIATVANGTAWLWDTANGERRKLPAETAVEDVSFSADGTIIAARAGSGIQVWTDDLPTGAAALLKKLEETTAPQP